LNENKYFLINRGDLDDRLDPTFYLTLKQIKEDIEDKARFRYDSVKRLCEIKRGKFGHRPRNDPKLYNGIYPFIQTGDIVRAANGNQKITYSQTLNELGKRTSRLAYPPQLLMTIAANIGNTAILDYECCYPDSIVAITPKNLTELPLEYLNIYFTLFQTYIERLAPFSAQRNLNNKQLGDVPIVIPSPEVTSKVIEKFNNGVKSKIEREDKTVDLLKEIDNYLLQELNVVLPDQPTNLIQNRIFKTDWQKLTGNRFDPKKYSQQSESLIACIENSMLRKVPLKSLVVHSVAGDWGLDEKEEVNPKLFTKCLVIRATEFDNDYNLNIENSRAKFRLISNTKLKKLDIKPNDFLLEKSGGSPDQPVGRISILENELLEKNTIAYSNFIHKFRVNTDEVLPEFLFCFLKTIHNIKLTDVMQSQTNGIRNLIMREYWNQSIILPNKTKQKEIADTIYQMRAEAKQTEMDAQQGFEQTKKEIEKLILE
jgi:type I restriction enzyme S subunit